MRKQEKAIIIVAAGDLLSTCIKFALAAVTGSLALLADAWHSLSDLATSMAVLVSLFLDRRETNRDPDASDKPVIIRRAGWELRVSFIIGILLMFVAVGVLKKAILGTTASNLRSPGIAALIVSFLILISYLRFRFESSVGKETGSNALIADAYHSRVDMYVLSLVLVSLGGELLNLRVDRYAAIIIGFMIFGVSVKIIYRAGILFFNESRNTEPEKRSIEDSLILVLMGGLFSRKQWVRTFFVSHLNWDDEVVRKRYLNSGTIILAALLFTGYLCTGFFTIDVTEKAILETFGNPVNPHNPVGPGLHYHYPKPIGTVQKVDVGSIRRLSFGYQSTQRKDLILWTNVHYLQEYAILTGDNTFLDIAANVHYRVKTPADFIYSSSDPVAILETIANSVLRDTMGHREFFDMLTYWRRSLEEQVTLEAQAKVDRIGLGIEILWIYFRDIHPPVDVAASFEDVVSAQEDLETFVEEARGYRKELLPTAEGESVILVEQAKAKRTESAMIATGKAHAFQTMEYAFQKYNDVNRFRLKMEMLEEVLPGVSKYIIDRNISKQPMDMFINTMKLSSDSLVPMMPDASGGQP
jgi:modulator of FtsH protease HflK